MLQSRHSIRAAAAAASNMSTWCFFVLHGLCCFSFSFCCVLYCFSKQASWLWSSSQYLHPGADFHCSLLKMQILTENCYFKISTMVFFICLIVAWFICLILSSFDLFEDLLLAYVWSWKNKVDKIVWNWFRT